MTGLKFFCLAGDKCVFACVASGKLRGRKLGDRKCGTFLTRSKIKKTVGRTHCELKGFGGMNYYCGL